MSKYMRIAKRLTFLTLKATPPTVSEIHEIYDRAEAMEEFVKTNFKETIFGRSTQSFYCFLEIPYANNTYS